MTTQRDPQEVLGRWLRKRVGNRKATDLHRKMLSEMGDVAPSDQTISNYLKRPPTPRGIDVPVLMWLVTEVGAKVSDVPVAEYRDVLNRVRDLAMSTTACFPLAA